MTELKPYQREGVRMIYGFRGRALLADEQGLGKTIQCLDWIRRCPARRPVVIVCPASVKYVWQSEAALHFNMRTEVLEGRATKKSRLPGDIVILNYDILPSWLKVLKKAKPQILVFDECHLCKNAGAKRTRALRKLAKVAASVIGTSGTPLTNRPIELWTSLNAINPSIFPDRLAYAWRYCQPRLGYRGEWVFDGATNTKELHRILRERVMIRRLKKDVLKELPPISQRAVPFKLGTYEEYDNAQKNFILWLKKKNPTKAKRAARSEALTKVGYMLRLVAQLKIDWTTKWIEEFFENHPEEKLVGLTAHRFVVDHLREKFKGRMLFIDGRIKGRARHDTVRAFQTNHRYRLLVGNWIAAGVGITLTASSNIAALDLPWDPATLKQGRDRIHRIGQKKPCTFWFLLALKTIEEKLLKLLRKKDGILGEVLDGADKNGDDVLNIFDELLDEMKRERV